MRIGLYFGSFNPIHTGHLIIANHIAEHYDFDKVWLVLSPHNPLKESSTLLHEYHRLHLVNLALAGNDKLAACDIEFKLPKPSYTIDTLTHLQEHYPKHRFSVIMGSDSFQNLQRWKNYTILLRDYPIIVYQRPGHEAAPTLYPNASITEAKAPMLDISSSYIRAQIKNGKSIQYLCPDSVAAYIKENRYYL